MNRDRNNRQKKKVRTNTSTVPERKAFPMRLNKYLALQGITTRRGADEMIEKGDILVNGKVAKIADKVLAEDVITRRGELSKKEYRYFAYNKKEGVTTTREPGTPDILTVAKFPVSVFPVGRLDKDSCGLIIMTNDGRVTRKLLDPDAYHEKEYRVSLDHDITNTLLRGFKEGVSAGAFRARPAQVRKTGPRDLEIILTEGQNRQIRRMARAFGYEVVALKRFRIGDILLGDLRKGSFREIKGRELTTFLASLGIET